jgi:ferredoxin-NADP reductase
MVGLHGDIHQRPYSIASSPEQVADTGRLELLVTSRNPFASAARLLDAYPGTLIDVDGPVGSFVCPVTPDHRRCLFVAGGSGIAPVRAMVDHLLRRKPRRQIMVLYSARHPEEFAFVDELRSHARERRLEVQFTVTGGAAEVWGGARGPLSRSDFEAALVEPTATLCFVSGPPALVHDAVTTLRSLGVPKAAIRTSQD